MTNRPASRTEAGRFLLNGAGEESPHRLFAIRGFPSPWISEGGLPPNRVPGQRPAQEIIQGHVLLRQWDFPVFCLVPADLFLIK